MWIICIIAQWYDTKIEKATTKELEEKKQNKIDQFENCITNCLEELKIDIKNIASGIEQQSTEVQVFISGISASVKLIASNISSLTETHNNNCVVLNEIKLTNMEVLSELKSIQSNLGVLPDIAALSKDDKEKLGEISECIDGASKELTESLSFVSNISSYIEMMQPVITSIKDTIDDNKNALEDVCSSTRETKNILEEFGPKVDGLALREEDVVDKYDELLRIINDEIVVKTVSDSKNMLKILKDCYNYLDFQKRSLKK
jgi:hypothetical protein